MTLAKVLPPRSELQAKGGSSSGHWFWHKIHPRVMLGACTATARLLAIMLPRVDSFVGVVPTLIILSKIKHSTCDKGAHGEGCIALSHVADVEGGQLAGLGHHLLLVHHIHQRLLHGQALDGREVEAVHVVPEVYLLMPARPGQRTLHNGSDSRFRQGCLCPASVCTQQRPLTAGSDRVVMPSICVLTESSLNRSTTAGQ